MKYEPFHYYVINMWEFPIFDRYEYAKSHIEEYSLRNAEIYELTINELTSKQREELNITLDEEGEDLYE